MSRSRSICTYLLPQSTNRFAASTTLAQQLGKPSRASGRMRQGTTYNLPQFNSTIHNYLSTSNFVFRPILSANRLETFFGPVINQDTAFQTESDRDYPLTHINPQTMASSTGTMRGTPKNNRGQLPAFNNSPAASNIPRPAFETHASQSEAGGSTMSASRQKQTKRDEVKTTRCSYPERKIF